MERFVAKNWPSESVVPGGELSFFGEADLAYGNSCCPQPKNVECNRFLTGEVVSR